MEEAAKSIESLTKHILPVKPHCLSISATRRYRVHPDDKRLEEQDHRPLQYSTFVSDADRGVTLTRAYFDIREEPVNPHNATSNAPTPRSDPTKPITKLSLKDYKNRAKAPDGESTPKSRAPPSNPVAPKTKPPPPHSKHAPGAIAKDMESLAEAKKGTPNSKTETNRRHSPSPETKKRAPTREEDTRPAKRIKGEDARPNAPSARLQKGDPRDPRDPRDPPNKLERKISHEKKPSKDLKSLPAVTTNGRSALGSMGNRSASPKSIARVNGSQKSITSNGTPKKTESNSHSQTSSVPPLLSPLRIAGLDPKSEDLETIRASPKKKTEESNSTKPAKKSRDDREPSPSPKKRKVPLKIPPLLSPTLPAIVMEELAKIKKTPSSKEPSQKSLQAAGSPQPPAQKTVKSSKREETIHVESKKELENKKEVVFKKEEPESFIVTLKYKKRIAKTVERLLVLPPGGKRKADGLKREERSARERSDSIEPGAARKRPRTGTEIHPTEAAKRPRTSEVPQPSTPLPKQASAMARVASSSSLAGTPGAANDLTPSTQQAPEAKRVPVDLEQVRKLQLKVQSFRELGTRLKHERDRIMRNAGPIPDEKHHTAMGAGTQSLLAYMLSFKLEADCRDLEQKARFPKPWKDMIPLIRAIKSDCRSNGQMTALLVRIQGICLVYLARALWSYPNQPEAAKDLLQNSKDQQETWRLAEKTRRGLGVYDGSSNANDGGPVGKLMDRLGPWSSPEEAIPVAIEILRKTIRVSSQWKPADELVECGHTLTNGAPN
ncbi:hypothetical protein SLS62_002272 [Diatrype stigma]|uniref:Uncharacterized protein n=1 Tax=Diatrype stigma TaxID=117547 RepID=A0AAN9YSF2_9PEZI